jgi:hypothetical protein
MQATFKKICAAAALSLLPILAYADEPQYKPDTTEITQELQKISRQNGIKMIWWIPDAFWQSLSKKPGDMDPLVRAVHNYTLVAVIDAQVSPLAAFTYKPEDEVRNSTKIYDRSGNAYSPIDKSKLSADLTNFLGIMKPVLANAMGQLGNNVVFVVFPAKGKDGKPIVVPNEPGRFQIDNNEEKFFYRLPLASLLPKLKCANDPELFPSNYKFCPFDGTPLVPLTN